MNPVHFIDVEAGFSVILPITAVLGLKVFHAGCKYIAERSCCAFVRSGCHLDVDRTRARIVVKSNRSTDVWTLKKCRGLPNPGTLQKMFYFRKAMQINIVQRLSKH